MRTPLLPACLGLATLAGPLALETRYATDRELALEIETILELETVELELERDGERMEPRGAGSSSRLVQRVSRVDRVLELDEDGAPVRVRRSFADVGGQRTVQMGEMERDLDIESPFDGLVLELHGEEGDVEARVISGRAPDSEALEGHRLALDPDALLPAREVEVGDEWSLDHGTIRRALGLDLAPHLFPRPAREEDGGGERGGRDGRGGWGGGGGGDDLLSRAEWSGTARLVELDAEREGMTCAAIELELEAHGELPERRGFGGGRGGRGGAPGLGATALFSNSFQIELEGKLWFALEERRPVRLELEGDVRTERESETSGRGGTMRMRRVEQGTLRHVVTLTAEPVAAD